MTQEDVIVLWKDANGWDVKGFETTLKELERFAKLVAKHTLSNIDPSKFMSWQEALEVGAQKEREACAKVCDEFNFGQAPMMIQRAIRARGEQA